MSVIVLYVVLMQVREVALRKKFSGIMVITFPGVYAYMVSR